MFRQYVGKQKSTYVGFDVPRRGIVWGDIFLTLALATVPIKCSDREAIHMSWGYHPDIENLERFRMSFSNHIAVDLASLVVST